MRNLFAVTAALALLGLSIAAQAAITIDTVAIGNAGNAADTTGYGSVGYNYNIGKYEVTAGQYTAFLNAVAATDTYGLYHGFMSQPLGCGITRSGASSSYIYTVASDMVNYPVNTVSYWDACRFSNWLSNGQGTGSTESGTYTLNGYNGWDGRTIQRNAGATWAVTSEDEWYKAAYYKGGSVYSKYANGKNTPPGRGTESNYAATTFSPPWDGSINGALEQNGTKDMMGNVWEWNEAIVGVDLNHAYRGLRGGSYYYSQSYFLSSTRYYSSFYNDPSHNEGYVGFRVSSVPDATVPEPMSVVLAAGGLVSLWGIRRRRA